MNLFSPILRLFGRGAISNNDFGYQSAGQGGVGTRSGSTVTDEDALKISAVWACVQLISNSVVGMPLQIFRDTATGREPVEGRHFLKDVMHLSPNRYMKPRDFRSALTVQMCLWNNAYAEKAYSGDRLVALMPLRPGRMTPFIGKDGDLTYHYIIDGGVKVYAKESILHLKGFGVDGVVGSERTSYAREAMGLSIAAETFASAQFRNGGRPGGVITFDKFLTPDQRGQAKQLYEGMAEGAIEKNKLWILEGGSKYEALDFAADQMQMIATRNQQLSEIARFFGVPGVMIGAGDNSSSSWPASFEQQMLSFLTFTVQPYLDEWECAIRYSLIPGSDENLNIDHDTSPLVKMDSAASARYLSSLVQNGLMTRNEARRKLTLPEVEGGNELTVQTNLTNIDDLEGINNANQSSNPIKPGMSEIRQ